MKWSTRYTVRELYGANRYPNSRGTEGAGARGNCADAYPATEAKKREMHYQEAQRLQEQSTRRQVGGTLCVTRWAVV